MNVREMKVAIWERPDCQIREKIEQPRGFKSFDVLLRNGWTINVAFGSSMKSGNRDRNFTDMESVSRVELLVTKPNGFHFSCWNLPPEEFPGEENGTLGWQKDEQVFKLIDRISGYPRGGTK